jgi:type I restriction enzyme S subunit
MKTDSTLKNFNIKEMCVDWKIVKLGDILSLEYGKALPEKERLMGKYPVYGSNGVVGYHKEFSVKGPGIVVGRKGTIGAVKWVDSDFWPIDTSYYIKTKNGNVFLKWLFYKLNQSNLSKLSQSDVVPGLKRELVYHITIPLPPLPEQRRIAEVLGTVDSAIQKVGGAIESTERLKKGLMQRLLTRGIGHERFKESEVGRVPVEWEVARLGELLIDIKYGTSIKADNNDKGSIVLGIPNILGGKIDETNLKFANLPELEKQNLILREGDILLVRTNANPNYIGRCALFENKKGIWVYASYLIRIRVNNKRVIPSYLIKFLHSERVRKQFLNIARTSAGNYNINIKGISSISIYLPPLPEQRRIAEILSAVDRKLELERRRKEKLERVKTGLMNELLTGKKRMKILR